MSAIRKRNGKFQARIHRRGFPAVSKTFLTRADAVRWAREAEVRFERTGGTSERPRLGDLIDRYLATVTPSKRNARVERQRLSRWRSDRLCAGYADEVRVTELASWRDQRLAESLGGSTVRNYLAGLSAVYRHAASEWGFHQLENPVARLKRPSPAKGRTRRVTDAEIAALKAATESAYLSPLIDLAVETGMRLGELTSLCWRNVDLTSRTAHLPDTKNGDSRTVPLSRRATEILLTARGKVVQQFDGRVFAISPHAVSVAFRRACARVAKQTGEKMGCDLHFHDLRHEAVSRLFELGLNPMEVAAISGHRSMQMLARYTHIRPTTLLARLG